MVEPVVSVGKEKLLREVVLRKTVPGDPLVLPAQFAGRRIEAVVDTAAQATVVGLDWLRSNRPHLQLGEKVSLLNAAKGSQMEGWKLRQQCLIFGDSRFTIDVIVTPISDDMLLGLDFLQRNGVVIDLAEGTVSVKGRVLEARGMRTQDASFDIGRATLSRKVVVPPFSERQVLAKKFCHGQKTFVFEPSVKNRGLLLPRLIVSPENQFPVIVRNDSDRYISLRKGHHLGFLIESAEVLEESDSAIRQVTVGQSHFEVGQGKEVPEFLQDLFERSSESLSESEQVALSQLLREFQDVFSKGDLDIGHFSGFQHRIDTGDAEPFKERMRRTPLGFQEEEEKHLRAMLAADVIQPSSSPWSSAPVLVRKKDGGLRWCVDFRKLNHLTRKDSFPIPRIEDCLDFLGGATFLSTLDMASGYWQIDIAD